MKLDASSLVFLLILLLVDNLFSVNFILAIKYLRYN